MNKGMRKFFAAMLSATVVASSIPTTLFAEEPVETFGSEVTQEQKAEKTEENVPETQVDTEVKGETTEETEVKEEATGETEVKEEATGETEVKEEVTDKTEVKEEDAKEKAGEKNDVENKADSVLKINEEQYVSLRQAGEHGIGSIPLKTEKDTDYSKYIAAVESVEMSPVEKDGTPTVAQGYPNAPTEIKLTAKDKEAGKWKIVKGRRGTSIEFNRTETDPIVYVMTGKNPVSVTNRWGGEVVYPQSQKYKITIKAKGYEDSTGVVTYYTGQSSTFAIIRDKDGNRATTDDREVIKTYSKQELEEMSTFANGSSQCGMTGFRTFSGIGVDVKTLAEKAGYIPTKDDSYEIDTSDHYGNTFTYQELFGAKRYFMESIYRDPEVKKVYDQTKSDQESGADIAFRRILAKKAMENNTTVLPRINFKYTETMLDGSNIGTTDIPTKANTRFNSLVNHENAMRFYYGIQVGQDDVNVTFDTQGGSEVKPQLVKSHYMTGTVNENTTMKSSYWASALIIYDGAGKNIEDTKESEAADKLTVPEDPTREGYVFGGWFTDKECKTPFEFTANDGTVDEDTTVYAKWIQDSYQSLRQSGTEGIGRIPLVDQEKEFIDAIESVTMEPVEADCKTPTEVKGAKYPFAPRKITFTEKERKAGKWDVKSNRRGTNIEFKRTQEDPIAYVMTGKNPIAVTNRWGQANVYPQSQKYKVTIKAKGFKDAISFVTYYTGQSSDFTVLIDYDGDRATTDDRKVIKTYTMEELEKMSTFANGSSQCGMTGFRTFSGEGVPVEHLVRTAGYIPSEKDSFEIDTSDHYGNTFTYKELFGVDRYFMEPIYNDPEVKATYEQTKSDQESGSDVAFRRILAEKTLQNKKKTKVLPRINIRYTETMLDSSNIGNTKVPTKENTTFDMLVNHESSMRFFYGIQIGQDDVPVTFDTQGGSEVESQLVKSHYMTGTVKENTTMKSSYWANALIVYMGGATEEEEKASEAKDMITVPEDPTKEGFEFAGWFTDPECTKEFDFKANDGTADEALTLYAKWNEKKAPVEPDENKPEVNKPDENKPEVNKPEVNKPSTNKPEVNKPSTNKQVKPSKDYVQTGDTSNIIMMFEILGASFIVIALIWGYRRKRR